MVETPAVGMGPTVPLGAVGLGGAGVALVDDVEEGCVGLAGAPDGDGEHPAASASATAMTTTERIRIGSNLSQAGFHLKCHRD